MKLRAFVLLLFATPLFAAHQVALTCSGPTSGGQVTGFNFYRGTATGGPYVKLNSAPTTACAYTDTTPEVQVEGSTFFYTATATGPGGESLKSAEVSATVPFSGPDKPTNLKAVPQ